MHILESTHTPVLELGLQGATHSRGSYLVELHTFLDLLDTGVFNIQLLLNCCNSPKSGRASTIRTTTSTRRKTRLAAVRKLKVLLTFSYKAFSSVRGALVQKHTLE